jgi:predicted RNA binding protein with dsRBD fold (UPF0201 family)
MENNVKKALNNFIDDPELEFEKKVQEDKKKFIKSDNTIIERVDKIIIDESGRQLLREQY